MKKNEIVTFANYIYKNFFNTDKILLEDYIFLSVNDLIINYPNYSVNDICETLGDPKTDDFLKFITEIRLVINKDYPANRLELIIDEPNYFIKLTDIGKNENKNFIQDFSNFLKKLEKYEKNKKGVIYENICSNFLIDMGLNAMPTKLSGDKGIDIKASYKIELPEKLHEYFINDDIYVLAQAKFFTKPVDTPVIRKLVGDSLFIRFSELEYVEIAHNAVHLMVFSHSGYTEPALLFAKKNKIILLTSQKIIRILSNKEKPYESNVWMYIKEITNCER